MNSNIDIDIDSNLVAVTTPSAEGLEEKEIVIHLRGSDTSEQNRDVYFKIMTTPRYGILFENNDASSPLVRGQVIDQSLKYPYDGSITLKYIGEKNFFTMPFINGTTGTDSADSDDEGDDHDTEEEYVQFQEYFDFAVTDSGKKKSSPVVRQSIDVINVNDAPTLNIPRKKHTLYTFSSLSWDSSVCYLDRGEDNEDDDDKETQDGESLLGEDIEFNRTTTLPSSPAKKRNHKFKNGDREGEGQIEEEGESEEPSTSCPSRTTIGKIQVVDVDRNLDYVRVDVTTSKGLVTLNQEYLIQANFASCSNRTANGVEDVLWNCQGTGAGDLKMTFITRPLDLNNILNGMTYESLEEGEDEIVVSIYDGAGEECLSPLEHQTLYAVNGYRGRPTVHPRCYSITRSIPVNVMKYQRDDSRTIFGDLPTQLIIAFSFGALVVVLIVTAKLVTTQRSRTLGLGIDKSRPFWASIFNTNRGDDVVGESKKKAKRRPKKNKGKQQDLDDDEDNNEDATSDRDDVSLRDREELSESEEEDRDKDGGEWTEYVDEGTGNRYYQNLISRRVTWTMPRSYNKASPAIDANSSVDAENSLEKDDYDGGEWAEYVDEGTGDRYYQNLISRRVTWTKPKSYKRIRDDKIF